MAQDPKAVLRAGRALAAWLNWWRERKKGAAMRRRVVVAIAVTQGRTVTEGRTYLSLQSQRWVLGHVLCVIRRSYKVGLTTPPVIFQEAEDYADERFPLVRLFKLIQAKRLDRLRECRCGRWFFARARGQRCCSEPCRAKAYWAEEKNRRRRREYMRKYKREERRRDKLLLSASER
jgi:hypothetical protein